MDNRKAFEDWYRSVHDPVDVLSFDHASGKYTDGYIQVAYLAWQAALSQQGEQEPIGWVNHGVTGNITWRQDLTFSDLKSGEPVFSSPQPATIPEGYAILPMELTAENGARALMMGEFSESVEVDCCECFGDGCDECEGRGSSIIEVTVGWDTIKHIWRKAANHFAAAPEQPLEE